MLEAVGALKQEVADLRADLIVLRTSMMDALQLAETTMDPRRRTLRRVTVAAAERAEQVFELLMGTEVGPRKDFIVAGADALDRNRIDA